MPSVKTPANLHVTKDLVPEESTYICSRVVKVQEIKKVSCMRAVSYFYVKASPCVFARMLKPR